MFDAINAEASYRRQQLSKDWRPAERRSPFRRSRSRKTVTDPAQSRRAPLASPAHSA